MRWTAGLFLLFATPALAASPQCAMPGPIVIKTAAPAAQPAVPPIGAAQPQQGKATTLPENLANLPFAQHIASPASQFSTPPQFNLDTKHDRGEPLRRLPAGGPTRRRRERGWGQAFWRQTA
jgi:hypothetical protein